MWGTEDNFKTSTELSTEGQVHDIICFFQQVFIEHLLCARAKVLDAGGTDVNIAQKFLPCF